MDDISNFGRHLKLKAHFNNNHPTDKNDESIRFRPRPDKKWTPPKVHHTISTFLESFENQVKRDVSTEKPITRNNLTLNEIKALKDLQKRDNIIIINADKGGAITILDTENYIKEANRQLKNTQCYQKLDSNHTNTDTINVFKTLNHTNTVNDTINMFKPHLKPY